MPPPTDGRPGRPGLGRLGRLHGPRAALFAALRLVPRVAAASSPSPAAFPYTPTTILVPSTNASALYILAPSAGGQVALLALNASATLSAASADAVTTLTAAVPFFASGGQETAAAAFAPSIRSDGSIFVLAGDCAGSDGSATVWTYTPAAAQWTSTTLSLSGAQSGPWFLGSSTAFSSQIAPTMSNSTVYVYGGMCPTNASSETTAATWQSHATYSNRMLKLVPSSDGYTPAAVPNKGPPVAEAGFTFTTLAASQSNRSGIVTQQVNSVVLGGHTETAFVNMSTAAIWSLPEEAWSFVSIANPTSPSPGNNELAVVRKAAAAATASAPDSRSGHTAVLSEDGNSLAILGGWVGDVGQAADPQLAILQMGPDYGQWQWSIPSAQPSGSGVYGHGAALLPGNVMMVYGGYNISSASASSTKLIRRRDASSLGSGLAFFNLTSLSWSEDYTNPTHGAASPSSPASTPPASSLSSTSASKIGLGIGLGLGIPLAILVVVLVVRSCRRRTRQRRKRNEAVRALAQDHHQFMHVHDEMIENGSGTALPFQWSPSDAYLGGDDPYNAGGVAARRSLGAESLRGARPNPAFPSYQSPTMAGGDEPSAFSIPRKPTRNVARGLYQPTTINDYEAALAMGGSGGAGAAAGGSGAIGIHPIYEAEEEDDDDDEYGAAGGDYDAAARRAIVRRPTTARTAESTGRSISPETEELTDPFMTPPTQSATGSAGGPARPAYAAYAGVPAAPATFNLNPFVRNSPSPEAGASRPTGPEQGGAADVASHIGSSDRGAARGAASANGQDRDVQEWVSGLEIEDLLFAPPVPGAGAAIAASVSPAPGQMGPAGTATTTQRGRVSPVSTNRHLSLRSKTSNGGSPTRGNFFGAAVAGAMAGVAGGWGAGDDEARTGSNLSDRSAFTFLSRTTSSRSRMGGGGNGGGGGGGGGGGAASSHGAGPADQRLMANSDSSSASFNTAPSGFHTLRAEGPALLYGKGHQNGSSAGGSFGAGSGLAKSSSSASGSIRGGASSPTGGYSLHAPPALPPQGLGHGPSPFEYGGAASVMASGAVGVGAVAGATYMDAHHSQRLAAEEDENSALNGSPSKLKGRRTWMGNLMRIFSSGSAGHAHAQNASGADDAAATSANSTGTGAQQGPNYQDMAHATLLRRKQGRSDWEAAEMREEESTAVGALRSGGRAASIGSVHGYSHGAGHGAGPGAAGIGGSGGGAGGSGGGGHGHAASSAGIPSGGSIAAGRRDGSGKSDDWDVEKAVQNRVVQVMFTMPRDQQLRVVNAEVEKDDDETDIANLKPGHADGDGDGHDDHDDLILHDDLARRGGRDDDDDGDLGGGLSAPPPPPVRSRPYQAYRSHSPLNAAASATAGARQGQETEAAAAIKPAAEAPPPPRQRLQPSILDQQDEQLRQLHEALAESKRLLSSKAMEPWMLDARDGDGAGHEDEDDAATFGGEEVHEDEAQAVALNKGKVVSVGWLDASSDVPPPLNTAAPAAARGSRAMSKQDRHTLATAAALARTLMASRATAPTPEPDEQPPAGSASGSALVATPARKAAASTAAAAPTAATEQPAAPTTPTRALRPARSAASFRTAPRTPTKTASAESLASDSTSASRASRRSGRRGTVGTLGGDTLLGSPAAAAIKKPAGFVLDMVDRIETGSPPKPGAA